MDNPWDSEKMLATVTPEDLHRVSTDLAINVITAISMSRRDVSSIAFDFPRLLDRGHVRALLSWETVPEPDLASEHAAPHHADIPRADSHR